MTEPLISATDPLGRSHPAKFVEQFAPLGATLRVETNSLEILAAFRTSFGNYRLPSSRSESDRFVIRLLVDPTFNELPPWPDPIFRGHGDLFYICVGRQNTAVANLEKGYASGFITPAMAADSVFLRNIFLDCLVLTLLTHGKASTHSYIHASAVARGTRGLIFSGPSQSGKSTLAFACARRGFQIVSDDVVYLEEGDDGLNVWGKPWHLRFLPDCARFFPELKVNTDALRFDGKDCVEINVEAFLPGQTQTRCRPEAIFFLERSNRVGYHPIERDKAIELLSRDLVEDRPEVLERHHRFWLSLIRKGSYILRCSEDLDTVVQLLERFLSKPAVARDAS